MTNSDDNAQKSAEEEVEGFRAALGPFVVAAETSRMPMIFTNAREAGHPIIFANDSFLALTGYGREEILSQEFAILSIQTDDPDARALLETGFKCEMGATFEMRCRRKDGETFPAAVYISPVHDGDARWFNILRPSSISQPMWSTGIRSSACCLSRRR